MMNRIRRLVLLFVSFGCFLVALPGASQAPGTEAILDYKSDILVQGATSLQVTETIRVHSLGEQIKHGIYRDFPTLYTDRLGNRRIVDFKVLQALRDGAPEQFRVADASNGKRVYLGNPNVILPPADYSYTLVYTVDREIGFFSDHDELYWNVTGNGWIFPIDRASATVMLPRNIPPATLRLYGYTGPQGARGINFVASVGADGNATFSTTQKLLAGEGLTIVVTWPRGYIQPPDLETRIRYFLHDNLSVLVGAAGLALLLCYYAVVWFFVGKDPPKTAIMPLYEPPANVSPAAMRYLVRMAFDDKTFASAIINMAAKGFLSIKESHGVYTLKKTQAGSPLLADEETAIAGSLFPAGGKHKKHSKNDAEDDDADTGGGTEIKLENYNHNYISRAIKGAKKVLAASEQKVYFVTNQLYLIPGIILSVALLAGMVLTANGEARYFFGFLVVWLSIWSVAVFFMVKQSVKLWKGVRAGGQAKPLLKTQARTMTLMAGVFSAFEIGALILLTVMTSFLTLAILAAVIGVNLMFHWLLKAPTAAGRQLLDKIEGFRLFLRAVDEDRLNRLNPPEKTPELFEKYLPYAVALDAEQAWAQQFSTVLNQSGQANQPYHPSWYSGRDMLAVGAFASSLGSAFSNAISASSTAPGTSSGGGGGGFSGGGGGGGGGGGW